MWVRTTMLSEKNAKPLLEDVGRVTLNKFVKIIARNYGLPIKAELELRRARSLHLGMGDDRMLIELFETKPSENLDSMAQ